MGPGVLVAVTLPGLVIVLVAAAAAAHARARVGRRAVDLDAGAVYLGRT